MKVGDGSHIDIQARELTNVLQACIYMLMNVIQLYIWNTTKYDQALGQPVQYKRVQGPETVWGLSKMTGIGPESRSA